MKRFLPLFFLSICLSSCKDLFQYNPNEVRLEGEDKDLNAKNIAKIAALNSKDTFQFVVIGDSQRFYEDLDNFVDHVNRQEKAAFVVLNGDITDFGLNREFKWISRGLKRLNIPYVSVIGNHDMLANGRLVYKEMFGAENFSFVYGADKFIFLNTNTMEVGHDGSLPDLGWLQGQLATSERNRNAFVFSHISPLDGEFDQTKTQAYADLLENAGNVRLSIHGHQHRFSVSQPRVHGVKYLVVSTIQKRSYSLITVSGQTYQIDEKFF